MEKEYKNCEYGLTPQCPHYDDPAMRKLFAPPKTSKGVSYINAEDLIAVDNLCEACDSFIPKEQ